MSNKIKHLTDKYLAECDNAAHSADPLHADRVLNDLRKRINTLTEHIRKLQAKKSEYQHEQKNNTK